MPKAPPWANFIPHDPSEERDPEPKPKAPPWANFVPGPSETPEPEPQPEPQPEPVPLRVEVGPESGEADEGEQDAAESEPEAGENEGTPVGVCKYCGKDFRHKRHPERSVMAHTRVVHSS